MKSFFTFLLLAGSSFGQLCGAYNQVLGPFPYTGRIGTEEHISSGGNHFWVASFGGSCSYTGSSGPCTVDSRATSTAGTTESGGSLVIPLYKHVGGWEVRNGAATSTGGLPASSDTQSAAAFRSCLGGLCGVSISINGSGGGAGFSVTLPPDKIYGDGHYYKVTCAGRTGAQRSDGCGADVCRKTPILVNVKSRGWHFTNPNQLCVRFDLAGDGKPACYSWPKPDSGLAFLVLDINGDGHIRSGAELFGNFSPQPPHPNKNGFLALMQYDYNHDLVIDAKDDVWPRLKLWIDEHCYLNPEETCSSRPEELHTLESEGIHALGVVYSLSDKVDKWGNQFLYYAQTNPKVHKLQEPEDEMRERRMYDVWLVTRPE